MISDNIENIRMYEFNESVKKALLFCETADAKEVGRHQITETIFAFVQKYDSLPLVKYNIEAHRKYIDLQYIVAGKEIMGCGDIEYCKPKTEYNEEEDFQLFKKSPLAFMSFMQGDFALFFPQDVHMPRCLFEKSMPITKVVVKIPVDEFEV